MSASEPPGDPNAWDPGDTSAVPVGPEPEPTGRGGSGGAGGWGAAPRTEPFAIAALVWAIVSIAVPIFGTIVAFVLAARAADLIRRSRGERGGVQYVTAARIVAGAALALWIVGGIAFLALRDGDSSSDNVAVPTQPPTTTVAPATTSTTVSAPTTTTRPAVTTVTTPPPTIRVIPPTQPPITVAPTTAAPTTVAPTTTKPPVTSTTTPDEGKAAKVQARLVNRVGASNRGVPDDERFEVSYTPGKDLLVTWAINNGSLGAHPKGSATCTTPPTAPPSTTSTSTTSTSTTSTTSTTTTSTTSTSTSTTTSSSTTTTTLPVSRTTQEQARYEAKQILASIRSQLTTLKLDIPGVQLVGTYPIDGSTDDTVVQVLYLKATVQSGIGDYRKAFDVPPAEVVQCLNPAFKLS